MRAGHEFFGRQEGRAYYPQSRQKGQPKLGPERAEKSQQVNKQGRVEKERLVVGFLRKFRQQGGSLQRVIKKFLEILSASVR